jgi:hypothetical protein
MSCSADSSCSISTANTCRNSNTPKLALRGYFVPMRCVRRCTVLLLSVCRPTYSWSCSTCISTAARSKFASSHQHRCAPLCAGPNSSQRPEFFADMAVLEAEVKSYMAERAAGPPEPKKAQSSRSNPFLNFLRCCACVIANITRDLNNTIVEHRVPTMMRYE